MLKNYLPIKTASVVVVKKCGHQCDRSVTTDVETHLMIVRYRDAQVATHHN